MQKIQEHGFSKLIGYPPIPDYAIKFRRNDRALETAKNVISMKQLLVIYLMLKTVFVGFDNEVI